MTTRGNVRGAGWVTMRQVAKLAEVSTMSVSRAFRDTRQVTAGTRERIQRAAAELGYVPNLVAANLSSGRSRMIAAIVPSIRNSSFSNMLQGLGDGLAAGGLHLMVAVAPTLHAELAAVRNLLGRRPDGVVLTGTRHHKDTVELLRAAGVAIVETWDSGRPMIDLGAGFDGFAAARTMTEFMIGKGYRRLGYADLGKPQEPRFADRLRGFRHAMRQAGLNASHVFAATEADGFGGGRRAVEVLIDREPRLEALCCVTDVFAAGAMFECARRRWDVPGRLAVTGFGDYEIASELPVGLTTIRTHGYEIGAAASRMLCDRLEAGVLGPAFVNVGFELVIRESA